LFKTSTSLAVPWMEKLKNVCFVPETYRNAVMGTTSGAVISETGEWSDRVCLCFWADI